MKKKRIVFAVLAVALFCTEAAIALWVHDDFIRPFFGDILIVIFLYCVIRTVFPDKIRYLSLYVLVFAVIVELTQAIPLVDLLGIHNRVIRVLMGTSFSWGDIVCYAVGILPLLPYDIIAVGRKVPETK